MTKIPVEEDSAVTPEEVLGSAIVAGRLAAGALESSGYCEVHHRDIAICWDCTAIAAVEAAAPLLVEDAWNRGFTVGYDAGSDDA